MADKKLRSKFLEDIQTKYNIVLSMKELTSACEVRGHVDYWPVIGQRVVFVFSVGCDVIEWFWFFCEWNGKKNKRDEN